VRLTTHLHLAPTLRMSNISAPPTLLHRMERDIFTFITYFKRVRLKKAPHLQDSKSLKKEGINMNRDNLGPVDLRKLIQNYKTGNLLKEKSLFVDVRQSHRCSLAPDTTFLYTSNFPIPTHAPKYTLKRVNRIKINK
jgi:hypothetical protein